MDLNYTQKEKDKVHFSQAIGILFSSTLVAMLVLYFLKLINLDMASLAILGFGSIILFASTNTLSIKFSRFWAGVMKTIACFFMLGFFALLFYFFAVGTMIF